MATGIDTSRPHRLDVATLLLLAFGGLLAGIGWLWGVSRLWESPAWTRREKLAGTLVPPVGIVSPLAANFVLAPSGAAVAVVVLLLVAALATPVWLASRAR